MNAEDIIRKNKLKRAGYVGNKGNKRELSSKIKYVRNLITRTLITIILVLGSIIYTNISPDNKSLYKKYVLDNSLSFTKINNIYHDLFGEVDIINKTSDDTTSVMGSNLNFNNIEKEGNSFKVGVTKGEAISVITSGIVVFIGEKDNLGETIIIQGNDGVDIWYSGITDVNAKIYDYVEATSILGIAQEENIYLTFNKDDQYLTYDEYFKEV